MYPEPVEASISTMRQDYPSKARNASNMEAWNRLHMARWLGSAQIPQAMGEEMECSPKRKNSDISGTIGSYDQADVNACRTSQPETHASQSQVVLLA